MDEIKTISQSELAKLIGKTKQYVSQIVNHRTPPVDVVEISGRIYVRLTDRTKLWIANNKRNSLLTN